MRKRYLPFGYQIEQGEIAIVSKESNAVRFIFEEYLAGKSLKEIADIMSAKDIPYHEGTQKWNQNMVGRILASKIYYDNVKYPPIISETQYNLAEKRRCEKHQAYSTILQPFRQDKRHIKALRQMQHTDPTPYIRQVATKGIELIREVCPIQ